MTNETSPRLIYINTFREETISPKNSTSPSTSSINLLLIPYFLSGKMGFLLKYLQILSLTFLESFTPCKEPTLISKANFKD